MTEVEVYEALVAELYRDCDWHQRERALFASLESLRAARRFAAWQRNYGKAA